MQTGSVTSATSLDLLDRLLLRAADIRAMAIWSRYAIATILVLLGFGLRLALFDPGSGYPYLLYFPTVVVAAAVIDRGAGFYAAALSTALAALSLGPSLGIPAEVAAQDFMAALLYLGLALMSAYLVEELHKLLILVTDDNRRLTQTIEQQALALAEAHHRTQNDLHILALTISRQAKQAEDPAARAALREAEGRILAFSRINQRLVASGRSRADAVDSAEFLTGLLTDMRQGAVGLRPISFMVRVEPHSLPLTRAVSLGVILSELVTNALKYAFPDDQSGMVRVDFYRDQDDLVLAVIDDGVGMTGATVPLGTGLGQQIIRSVVAQIAGTVDFGAGDYSRGTACVLRFLHPAPAIREISSVPGQVVDRSGT